MALKKYSLLIVVNDDDTITVQQFENSTECKNAYVQAVEDGKDAYFYLSPRKTKTSVPSVGPISITK